MYNPRAYTQDLFQISLWMHLHYHHHQLLDWYPGKNNLSVTHIKPKVHKTDYAPTTDVTTAYYSRQSLSHSLNKKQRNGATLEWVGSGKGQGRAGPMGKRSAAALGGKRERERQHFSWLPAVEGFLCELGQNEMESSYIYSLCKGLVQIAHLYICESYKTMNTTNMESFCVTKKRPTRSEKTKPQTSNR